MKKLIILFFLLLIPATSLGDVIYQDDVFSKYENIDYEPYDYFEAYHNPLKYKGTYVVFEGLAALSFSAGEDASIFYVNTSRKTDKSVLLIVDIGPGFSDSFSPGDVVSVKGIAMGDSTELDMTVKNPIVYPISIEIIKYGPLSPKYTPEIKAIGYAKKGVNLRSSPDSSSQKVGYLKQGEKVNIITPNYVKNWHQISYYGLKCYVSAKYIEIE